MTIRLTELLCNALCGMTPQSNIQSWTIHRVQNAVEESRFPEERILRKS